MQDINGILGGGGGGRICDDRRLTAAEKGNHHDEEALKCPRCDSLNTKFCYYNNYNLSQPRHFCKNCRRYWTKGGVLRNVPVGGGCRKSKRSSKRKTASSPPPPSSRSSSESTSANATDTAGKAQSTSFYADAMGSEYSSSSPFNISEKPPATVTVTFNGITTPTPPCSGVNANFEQLETVDSGAGGMFTEIGSFVDLTSGDQHQNLLGFCGGGEVDPAPFRMHQQNQMNHHRQDDQLLVQNLTVRGLQMEKMEGGEDHWVTGGALGWHGVSGGGDFGAGGGGGGHLGLYDLAPGSGVVDHGHWSGSAQWNGSDHHLYLPP